MLELEIVHHNQMGVQIIGELSHGNLGLTSHCHFEKALFQVKG
jgi:hypothetical protein